MDLGLQDHFTAARPGETGEFRPLDWPGLCARIGARQALRASIDGAPVPNEASFSAASARRLVAMRVDRSAAETPVNPILSAAGKDAAGTSASDPSGTGSGRAAEARDTIVQVRNEL